MVRILLTPAIILLLFISFASSQSLNLRFNTHVYLFERADSTFLGADSVTTEFNKTMHVRSYQNLLLDVSKNKFSFNTLVQADEDISGKMDEAFNYRVYNAFIKGTSLFNVLDMKLGRQYNYAGVGKGTIDGLNLKFKLGKNKQYQFTAYGGILTPLDYSFENYGQLNENFLAGGMFTYYSDAGLTASLSYALKNKKPSPITYTRVDSLFNPEQFTIDLDPRSDHSAGVDLTYDYKDLGRFFSYIKAYFDIENKKFKHIEANSRIRATDKLQLHAGYMFHEPQIEYNSLFSVFTQKELHEIEGGFDYNIFKDMDAFIRASYVIYNSETPAIGIIAPLPTSNSLRLQVGINNPQYGLQYTRIMGYAGESDGVYGYYYRQLFTALSAHLSLNYNNYYMEDFETADGLDREKVDAFSGILGVTYRPNRHFAIDAQGQYLFNKVYKSDMRFLLGVNFWLFKNFNR